MTGHWTWSPHIWGACLSFHPVPPWLLTFSYLVAILVDDDWRSTMLSRFVWWFIDYVVSLPFPYLLVSFVDLRVYVKYAWNICFLTVNSHPVWLSDLAATAVCFSSCPLFFARRVGQSQNTRRTSLRFQHSSRTFSRSFRRCHSDKMQLLRGFVVASFSAFMSSHRVVACS